MIVEWFTLIGLFFASLYDLKHRSTTWWFIAYFVACGILNWVLNINYLLLIMLFLIGLALGFYLVYFDSWGGGDWLVLTGLFMTFDGFNTPLIMFILLFSLAGLTFIKSKLPFIPFFFLAYLIAMSLALF